MSIELIQVILFGLANCTVGAKMKFIFGFETILNTSGCKNLQIEATKIFVNNIDIQSLGSGSN
jgi:hypothetical protein